MCGNIQDSFFRLCGDADPPVGYTTLTETDHEVVAYKAALLDAICMLKTRLPNIMEAILAHLRLHVSFQPAVEVLENVGTLTVARPSIGVFRLDRLSRHILRGLQDCANMTHTQTSGRCMQLREHKCAAWHTCTRERIFPGRGLHRAPLPTSTRGGHPVESYDGGGCGGAGRSL